MLNDTEKMKNVYEITEEHLQTLKTNEFVRTSVHNVRDNGSMNVVKRCLFTKYFTEQCCRERDV
jgi:hypothetical protein